MRRSALRPPRSPAALGVSPLLAQCLVNRGIAGPDAGRPLFAAAPEGFGGPAAAARTWRRRCNVCCWARQRGEPLVIFGDYDVDGVTSTALLLETLRALGWNVNYYLPHRMDEGYGLSRDGGGELPAKNIPPRCCWRWIAARPPRTPSPGSAEKGTEVIVLDHHQVSAPPPAGGGAGQSAPGRSRRGAEFCSAGLAFKLAHALVKQLRARRRPGGCQI